MGYLRGQAAAYKSRTHYCLLSYSRVKKGGKLLSSNTSRIALDRVKLKILKFLESTCISRLDKIIKGDHFLDRLTFWEVDVWFNRWMRLSSFQFYNGILYWSFLQTFVIICESTQLNTLMTESWWREKNLKLFEDILHLFMNCG